MKPNYKKSKQVREGYLEELKKSMMTKEEKMKLTRKQIEDWVDPNKERRFCLYLISIILIILVLSVTLFLCI